MPPRRKTPGGEDITTCAQARHKLAAVGEKLVERFAQDVDAAESTGELPEGARERNTALHSLNLIDMALQTMIDEMRHFRLGYIRGPKKKGAAPETVGRGLVKTLDDVATCAKVGLGAARMFADLIKQAQDTKRETERDALLAEIQGRIYAAGLSIRQEKTDGAAELRERAKRGLVNYTPKTREQ